MMTKPFVAFKKIPDTPEIIVRISAKPITGGKKMVLEARALCADSMRPHPDFNHVARHIVENSPTELKRATEHLCALMKEAFSKHAHPRALIAGEKKAKKEDRFC